MKRMILLTMSVAFLAGSIASCGKSTKGKIANTWKMVAFEEETEGKSINGDRYISKTVMSENTLNTSSEVIPASGTSSSSSGTAVVKAYDYIIGKDGTWSIHKEIVSGSENNSIVTITDETGSWNFVAKTKGDEFKRNERIMFHVLTSSEKTTQYINQAVVTDHTDNATYIFGDNMRIYTIVSSSKNQLEMTRDTQNEYSTGSDYSINSMSQRITLNGK